MSKKLKCAVVGATGYTGVELLRLLERHPFVRLEKVISRHNIGKRISELLPNHFTPKTTWAIEALDVEKLAKLDVVFFATPHGVSMNFIPQLIDLGVVVIDLSADFRMSDSEEWKNWYGMNHLAKNYLSKAVYGLSEIYHSDIKKAQLIACPGCYPTAVSLGLAPLAHHYQPTAIVADCKSGISGTGRQANQHLHFCDMNENFYAYGQNGHRHFPEIMVQLKKWFSVTKNKIPFVFSPHVMSSTQGMYVSLYITLPDKPSIQCIKKRFEEFYRKHFFVSIVDDFPRLLSVVKTNEAVIGMQNYENTLLVCVAIDNLLKGASGQAVQNMNIRFGFDEQIGFF